MDPWGSHLATWPGQFWPPGVGHLAIWPGGSERASLDQASFEQVRVELLERGLLTEQEITQVLSLLEDPTFAYSSPIMFSAWGRRPAR